MAAPFLAATFTASALMFLLELGMAKAFTVIVASQLLTALLFDQFGLFGAAVRTMDLLRVAGLVFLILGVWLVLR